MRNKDLAVDYITRAGHRLEAAKLLFDRKSYADVVRESQELVELALKALLRISNIEIPRVHDVGPILVEQQHLLPKAAQNHVAALSKISKNLRRDRELAFYGSEDLTPSDFYREEDAHQALQDASWVYSICKTTLST